MDRVRDGRDLMENDEYRRFVDATAKRLDYCARHRAIYRLCVQCAYEREQRTGEEGV